MKNIKAITAKTLLVTALFVTPAFADGDMGGGGFANYETGSCSKSGSTNTLDGDMGGGGFTGDMGGGGFCSAEEETLMDSIIRGVSEYFDVIG